MTDATPPGRVPALLLVAALVPALLASPVQGHAIFQSSTPANGAQLAAAPSQVNITYDEAIREIRLAQVVDQEGRRVHAGPASVDADDPRIVHLPLSNLSEGLYTTRWAVASADAHNVSGAFFFYVGSQPPTRSQLLAATGTADSLDLDPVEPPLRAALYGGFVLLVGVPVAARYAVDPTTGPRRRRERLLVGLGAGLLAAGAALLALRRFQAGDVPLAAFLVQPAGLAGLLPGLGAFAALAALRRRDAVRRLATCGAGLLGAIGVALTSHSAALFGGVGLGLDVLHLASAGLWAGGVVALTGLLLPDIDDLPPGALADAIRAFSPIAILGLGLAAATGLAMAAWHNPSQPAWTDTAAGTMLIAKIALALGALALGIFHRFGVTRDLLDDARAALTRFRTSIRLEATVLLAVLAVSSVLMAAPTGIADLADDPPSPATRSDRFRFSGELDGERVATWIDVDLEVAPGGPGLNVFTVTVTRDGDPVDDVERVEVDPERVGEPADLPGVQLTRDRPGTWSNVSALPLPGTWDLRVRVLVDGSLNHVDATVSTAGPGADPEGPLSAPLRAMAVGAVAATVAGLAWERGRRR